MMTQAIIEGCICKLQLATAGLGVQDYRIEGAPTSGRQWNIHFKKACDASYFTSRRNFISGVYCLIRFLFQTSDDDLQRGYAR